MYTDNIKITSPKKVTRGICKSTLLCQQGKANSTDENVHFNCYGNVTDEPWYMDGSFAW